MEKTILTVDDEKDIRDILKYNLEKDGYKVLSAKDGKEALELVLRLPDLILLDILMPVMDGLEVCRRLKGDRITSAIPVIFLTARGTEFDEVLGLELGADDYIIKPIAIRTLLSRIRSTLRRTQTRFGTSSLDIIQIDNLEINIPSYTVKIGNTEIRFTRKEFETLAHLARNKGRVIGRDSFLSVVWGEDVRVTNRTVDVHISKIRQKLGSLGGYIETVTGIGYRFKIPIVLISLLSSTFLHNFFTIS